MSTSSISSSLFNANILSQLQQFQSQFAQLGQDLSSGSMNAAETDFITLQNDLAQATSTITSTSQSNNPIAQAFNKLSTDLQSGNLSASQSDYATIQKDFQSQSSQMHHHHHHGSGGSQDSQVSSLLNQLGQALQSSNLSGAQADFAALQQLFQGNTSSSTSSGSASIFA